MMNRLAVFYVVGPLFITMLVLLACGNEELWALRYFTPDANGTVKLTFFQYTGFTDLPTEKFPMALRTTSPASNLTANVVLAVETLLALGFPHG